MISFENDYSEGAHFNILKRLIETDMVQETGYCHDSFCLEAEKSIKAALGREDADVRFVSGGTQANLVVISSMLRSYEGVIAANTGHVSIHEGGAIEHFGHKVIELQEHDGKLDPVEVMKYLVAFSKDQNNAHEVAPGMIYISHPTEFGTLYTLNELKALRILCDKFGLKLYMDGARLAYGLMSKETDVTLQDVAEYCDVFYIGGTKVGALLGEALVFMRGCMPDHFETLLKQKGALMAKGRILGIQFAELFKDGLYFELGKNAIEMAEKLKQVLADKGYSFYRESPTNQQFVIVSNAKMKELADKVRFSYWDRYDDQHTVIRFCTSWATKASDIEELRNIL